MKLKDYKRILQDILIGVVAFSVFILYYKIKNPSIFPELLEKIIWAVILLITLLIVVSFNYKKIIRIIKFELNMRKPSKRIKFTFTKLSSEDYVKLALNYIFQGVLILFLITLVINEYIPIKFININYFLVIVLVFGVITVFAPAPKSDKKTRITRKDNYLTLFLGILGAGLIFIKINPLGWLAYLISIIAGILIILLSYLLLQEGKDET